MLAYIGIASGDLLIGYVSQYFKSRKKALMLFYILSIIGMILFFSPFNNNDSRMYLICAFLGFSTGYWAIFNQMAAEQFGTNLRATAATTIPNMVRGALPLINFLFLDILQKKLGWDIVQSGMLTGAIVMVIICITEGIPVADMAKAKGYVRERGVRLIGPNCPGVITADEAKVGIMPGFVFKKGSIGIVSKSGTLTYEAADQLVKAGLGITTAIGIGGDPIIGTTTKEAVELLMNDDETLGIVMIGEIGGQLEAEAARWIKADGNRKPVVGFIAGETAPKGRTMGHAGAIVGGSDDTAQSKKAILRECGIHVVDSPAHIGKRMAELFGVKA